VIWVPLQQPDVTHKQAVHRKSFLPKFTDPLDVLCLCDQNHTYEIKESILRYFTFIQLKTWSARKLMKRWRSVKMIAIDCFHQKLHIKVQQMLSTTQWLFVLNIIVHIKI